MPQGKNRYSIPVIFALLLLCSSCNSDVVYTGSKPMAEETWTLTDIPHFKIPITDTLSSNNLYFTLRIGSSYPFRNIYLFVNTISPDGKSITDTLQYNLADQKGNWLGKGFGDIKEINLQYKSNVYFPVKGTYQFIIQHGMRIKDLKGVYDFGIRIEKYSK